MNHDLCKSVCSWDAKYVYNRAFPRGEPKSARSDWAFPVASQFLKTQTSAFGRPKMSQDLTRPLQADRNFDQVDPRSESAWRCWPSLIGGDGRERFASHAV
jgi:hypothetical protein